MAWQVQSQRWFCSASKICYLIDCFAVLKKKNDPKLQRVEVYRSIVS